MQACSLGGLLEMVQIRWFERDKVAKSFASFMIAMRSILLEKSHGIQSTMVAIDATHLARQFYPR